MPNTCTHTHMHTDTYVRVSWQTHITDSLSFSLCAITIYLSLAPALSRSLSLTRILRSSCGSNKSLTANKSTRINSNVQRRAWPDFIYDIATKTLTAKCPPDSRKSKGGNKKKEASSRGGVVHPMYSIHGTEVSCEQFQFVRLHLQ